jgi:hypothetical protein
VSFPPLLGLKEAGPVRRVKRSRPLGVLVARALLAGDYDRARTMIEPYIRGGFSGLTLTWSVPEARALVAAIRVANGLYGTTVSPREFGL